MLRNFRIFHNAEPLWQRDIPRVPVDELVDNVLLSVSHGGRLAQWFGQKLPDSSSVRIYAILADDSGRRLGVMAADVAEAEAALALVAAFEALVAAFDELVLAALAAPVAMPA